MPKVVAKQEVWYEGRTRNVGEYFDCTDMDAKILEATGKVDISKEPVSLAKAAPTNYQTKVETPSQPMTTETAGDIAGKTRRRYQRRDMTAEDTD